MHRMRQVNGKSMPLGSPRKSIVLCGLVEFWALWMVGVAVWVNGWFDKQVRLWCLTNRVAWR